MAKAPAFKNPASNCNAPANKTANKNKSNEPIWVIADKTIADNPAAGPLTLILDSLINPTTRPPIIPAIIPESKGAPLAKAIPKQKGARLPNKQLHQLLYHG